MHPPIASPFEEKPQPNDAPLSGRIEWNAARECLVVRYTSTFRGRLRCEIYTGLRTPAAFLGVTLLLPLTVLLLAILWAAQRSKQHSQFSVFPQGWEDVSNMNILSRWAQTKRVFTHQGDFHIKREGTPPGVYLCRESFAPGEAQRLEQIVESLRQSEGANWDEIARAFRSS